MHVITPPTLKQLLKGKMNTFYDMCSFLKRKKKQKAVSSNNITWVHGQIAILKTIIFDRVKG